MSKEFDEVKAAWNKQADGFNQWPELCEEEKVNFAFTAGRALGRREAKGEWLCECLPWLLLPLRKAIKDQNAAWFRDHKNPPSNIKVEWVTGIDSAQMLLTEVERLAAIEAIPEEA